VSATALVAAVLLLLTLVACGGTTANETSCPAGRVTGCRPAIIWLIPLSFLHYPGLDRGFIRDVIGNDQAFVYSSPGSRPSAVGVPTADYTSYAGIKAAFAAGTLPGRYRAVIYDNELWPYTPVAEQKNPAHYERLVSRLLHRHGLLYIATPAPDLMWATGRPKDSYTAYLRHHLAGEAARYADIIDIQAQVREADLPEFVSFVTGAVNQSREANRHIKILIGLRTNPGSAELLAAYRAVAGLADGYWLNVNGRPQVAMYLLRWIYRRGSG
jgi:hypothetical protein